MYERQAGNPNELSAYIGARSTQCGILLQQTYWDRRWLAQETTIANDASSLKIRDRFRFGASIAAILDG
jgi:hypothetical protein